jgi:hypothetical protein
MNQVALEGDGGDRFYSALPCSVLHQWNFNWNQFEAYCLLYPQRGVLMCLVGLFVLYPFPHCYTYLYQVLHEGTSTRPFWGGFSRF